VALAPDASENGLATMLAELVRQNLEAKPHKTADLRALRGRVAIVAEDADVALTLVFDPGGKLTVHDGITGIPNVTIRGPAEAIMALSTMPLTRFGLPFPDPRDPDAVKTVRTVVDAVRSGALHVYGMMFHLPLLLRLTRLMSIYG
jgi:hypothetical protein